MSLFKNSQWEVTERGLSSVSPPARYVYEISKGSLLERAGAGNGEYYDWPAQMIPKIWVDADAFIEAYEKAIEIHRPDVDTDLLRASIDYGKKHIRRAAD